MGSLNRWFKKALHFSIKSKIKLETVCSQQVWAAIPPWKRGSLAEFVVLSANEVRITSQSCNGGIYLWRLTSAFLLVCTVTLRCPSNQNR